MDKMRKVLLTPKISEKTGIPLSSVAGTLTRLVKAGFAKREIVNYHSAKD